MKKRRLPTNIIHRLIFLSIACYLLTDCTQKKACEIEPITKTEIDFSMYIGNIIVKNFEGKIDTLYLIDNYDRFENFSTKSPLNHRECGHYVGFTYEFNDEIIEINFFKNEMGIEISLSNNCRVVEQMITRKSFKQNSTFQINLTNCDKSEIEEVRFINFELNSLKFKNNKQWTIIR